MSVSWQGATGPGDEGVHRGEAHVELVQMNNLYRIPGIVCQGDDGRPVCKPKQTEQENTHTLTSPEEGGRGQLDDVGAALF